MDKQAAANSAVLCGHIYERPVFSHSCHGRDYYTFPIAVPRLSGTEDTIIVIAEKSVIERAEITQSSSVKISGELRSHNNHGGQGNKLKIFLYAFEIVPCDEPCENSIILCGTICKLPRLRTTPLGREICDILLAVNRSFGHSDYLPCICWGQLARVGAQLGVGDSIELHGRIQSRDYIKNLDNVKITKTAYEVSVMEMTTV